MARWCSACGRDVHDPDEHELVKVGPARYHTCKNLVLVGERAARDLVTGERRVLRRFVPETPQRTKMNLTRWVHRDTLEAQDDH